MALLLHWGVGSAKSQRSPGRAETTSQASSAMKAPIPPNEAARLAALRALDILDTPPEETFDDLATLAASVCQVPIALISLVDDERQWFKSRVGWTVGQTLRDISFCGHAILGPDLLVVPDATADRAVRGQPARDQRHGRPVLRRCAPGDAGRTRPWRPLRHGPPPAQLDGGADAELTHPRAPRIRTRVPAPEPCRTDQHHRGTAAGRRGARARSRNRLAILLDHLPVMIYGLDAEGRFCLWNRECERVMGYTREEVLRTQPSGSLPAHVPRPAAYLPGVECRLKSPTTATGIWTRP